MNRSCNSLLLTALLLAPWTLSGAEIDLRPQWDDSLPLANPHKGWYHHSFDNTVEKYLIENDVELTSFPGQTGANGWVPMTKTG